MQPRPSTLSQVACRAQTGQAFEYELADFLHEFAFRGHENMLLEEPPVLGDAVPMGPIFDAYLAAVAVSLSVFKGWPAPQWTRQDARILREPWFAKPGRHMRTLLLLESPAAFRERNLFVTANALSIA